MPLEPLNIDLAELESFPRDISRETWAKLDDCVSKCMIPVLSKPVDEYFDDKTPRDEVISFIPVLAHNINNFLRVLNVIEKEIPSVSMDTNFFLRIYYLAELMKAKEFWHNELYSACLNKVSKWLVRSYDYRILFSNENQKDKDKIFKICMEHMHSKLTINTWKCAPTYVYLYCNIIQTWLKASKVHCPLHLVCPATMMLIEDTETENKKKGFKCLLTILKHLDYSGDSTGYDIVIYEMLLKYLRHRDRDILDECLKCVVLILEIVDKNVPATEWRKHDDVFEIVLGDLYIEPELPRKQVYVQHLHNLIKISGNSSVRWKKSLMTVIKDIAQFCLSGDILSPILKDCLEIFKLWMKTGWVVWKYDDDSEMVIVFYKILLCLWDEKEEDAQPYLTLVEECVSLCIGLCDKEQKEILLHDECFDVQYCEKWKIVQNKLKQN